MDRREALKYTAFLFGAGLSASTISAIISGCNVDTSDNWMPSFFTKEESDFIAELGETMLPRTHTPGAKDALVERFLDTVRPLRYTEADNQKFREKLTAFMAEAEAAGTKSTSGASGSGFMRASADERFAWLTDIDREAYEVIRRNPDLPHGERPFYLHLKEQILGAYFSSEVVAKSYFAFDPIPGRYDPCIPLSDVGKAWAHG